MRKLIVSSLVSIDGVHDDPQSWIGDYFDAQAVEESLAAVLNSGAMLMGRNAYEYFAPAWSSPSNPYIQRIHDMPKYVFSSTMTTAAWNNTTIISGDPVDGVAKLKAAGDGQLMIYGYGKLSQTLLEHHLVDELHIIVNPVVVGSGSTMFSPGERVDLRLEQVSQRRNGVVVLSYRSAEGAQTA